MLLRLQEGRYSIGDRQEGNYTQGRCTYTKSKKAIPVLETQFLSVRLDLVYFLSDRAYTSTVRSRINNEFFSPARLSSKKQRLLSDRIAFNIISVL